MKLKWKIVLPVLTVMLLSTLLTTVLSYTQIKRSIDLIVDNIIDSSLDTLVGGVNRAREMERVIAGEISLKNMTSARAFAEIIRLEAGKGTLDLQNTAYFQNIAKLLNVAEINVVDGDGAIVGSNLAENYGFNYAGSDSTRKYMDILADPAMEIVEAIRESAVSGDAYQYLGTARQDAKGFVQVGFDANAVRDLHTALDIRHIAENMRVGSTGGASILRNGVFVYSRNAERIGQDVTSEAWYQQISSGRGKEWIAFDGERMYAGYANVDGMTLLALYPRAEYNASFAPIDDVILIGVISALLINAITYFVINRISKTLVRTSRDLGQATISIVSAADHLAASSRVLIESGAKQVASIEDTGATMDETTAMVKQTDTNTKLAAQKAREAETTANDGKDKVIRLIGSMEKLAVSSSSIEKIVGTIDTIAFQTTILALNAAVEAARAGDAGQGFAVVASEVRALAQKSAGAAAETSNIIKENIALSNEGVQSSGDVRKALERIAVEIADVNSIVGEITAASAEQEKSVGRVDSALTQIKNITQSNTAVSEAVSEASVELKSQSAALESLSSNLGALVNGSKWNLL